MRHPVECCECGETFDLTCEGVRSIQNGKPLDICTPCCYKDADDEEPYVLVRYADNLQEGC